jgi:hypothetical protein
MAAVPRPRPPHLHRETNRHGKTVWYVRVGKGPRIRIRAEFGTEGFKTEYEAAIAGDSPAKPGKAAKGSLEWLWMLYRQTDAWTNLSRATKRQRENIMKGTLKLQKNLDDRVLHPLAAEAWGRCKTFIAKATGKPVA